MDMSLKYQGAGVRLVKEGLLIDPGRNIFLIFSTTSKIEGQCALLLPHTVNCLYDIVASISLTRLLKIETSS